MTVTVGANAEPRAPKRKRTAQISRVRLAPECVGHPAVHQGAYRRAERSELTTTPSVRQVRWRDVPAQMLGRDCGLIPTPPSHSPAPYGLPWRPHQGYGRREGLPDRRFGGMVKTLG